ncbi:Zinc finger CCHC domain-containing protein 3 [Acropora cervicornis]|uniref:Zinc finger CCHC domain-containing protein 3 n=1 Tax=Acropora cervicornis TaxID=6130 RepID=A0AAD9PPW6_ACRCE|nr:Zinc finger CCHC domain-containing protein 3 [Acropora cervicornis]
MDPPRESSDSIEANADVGVTSAPHGLSSENVSARCESSSEAAPVRESYADVASVHRNSVAVDDVINVSENSLPTRPLTVSFQPRYFLPACDVFDALSSADLQSTDVSCVQRLSSGAIVLTFRRPDHKEAFLRRNFITVHEQPLALQDVDRPLTFLQVFDAPHELPDTALISRLSRFCDVISNRRGYFREPGWENVQDGVRHFRVRLRSPVPSFLRFGKFLVHVRYNGQTRTCRHCHLTGHLANSCSNVCCYNCDETGHLSSACPHPVMCNICKSTDHKANACSFSWAREVPSTPPHDENSRPPTEPNDETTANHTDDDMSDVSNEDDDDILHDDEDVFLAELRSKPDDDDVSVANPGIFPTNDDSPTNNVLTDSVDPQPVEDSPNLFSVDETNDETAHLQPTTRSSGRKPAKILEVTIPLRTPTHPTLVTGKTAEKRDNAELSGPSDTEISPKKNRSNSRRKKPLKLSTMFTTISRPHLSAFYLLKYFVGSQLARFRSDWAHLKDNSTPSAISPSPSYLYCLNIFKHLITRISDVDSFQFTSKFCYRELLKDTATKPIVPIQWSVGLPSFE